MRIELDLRAMNHHPGKTLRRLNKFPSHNSTSGSESPLAGEAEASSAGEQLAKGEIEFGFYVLSCLPTLLTNSISFWPRVTLAVSEHVHHLLKQPDERLRDFDFFLDG
jgi:hypothetical protein